MITQKSLYNPKRRMSELRKANYKLRSLKRGKFTSRIFQKTIGNELALLLFIKHVKEFLECSFDDYSNSEFVIEENKKKAFREIIVSLSILEKDISISSRSKKPVPSSTIKRIGSATRKIYHLTRKDKIQLDCDEFWNSIVLCSIPLFS